jgi:hypothetical protein
LAIKTFGKLQTGVPDSLEFGFYGFRGGLNVKAAPQLVGDEDLTIATNGYLRPDGAFQLRNGMAPFNATPLTGAYPTYIQRFYQTIVNGSSISELKSVLAAFHGNLWNVGASSSTNLGAIGTLTGPVSWVQFQDPDDPNYVSGLTDAIVICTGSGGPYVWDGTNLYTPTGWANAAGAKWCAIVNGIIWFGGIAAYPNQIFGTGDGIIASMETLPVYRNFIMSSMVVGLCAQGTGATATLVIARNTGISVLYGTGVSTFFLQDVPFQDGIVSGASMVSANGIVFMLGHMAFYSFDAQTVPKVTSQKIEPWILNDPFTPGFPMTGHQNLTWAAVYNNRLHLGYCSASSIPNTVLCLDLTLNAWTVLAPAPGLASMTLLNAPGDPDPYTCYVGSSSTGQVYQWDYVPGTLGGTVLDDATPVLAQAQSKYFKIGVPGTNKSLQRFYPEFQVTGVFNTAFTVSTDYGLNTSQAEIENPAPITNLFVLDVSELDFAVLAGPTAFSPFGPPLSRLDLPGLQGESFAFGVAMSTPLAPWIWSGGSGVYNQRGRT